MHDPSRWRCLRLNPEHSHYEYPITSQKTKTPKDQKLSSRGEHEARGLKCYVLLSTFQLIKPKILGLPINN